MHKIVQIVTLSSGVILGAAMVQATGTQHPGPAAPDGQNNTGKGIILTNTQDETMEGLAGKWTVTEAAFGAFPPEATITMVFANGTLSGVAACNIYEATAGVDNGTLTLGPITLNSELCDTALLEAEVNFVRMLERSNRFEIAADGELTLFSLDFMMLKARR